MPSSRLITLRETGSIKVWHYLARLEELASTTLLAKPHLRIIDSRLIHWNSFSIQGFKMDSLPNCPQCNAEFTYQDGPLLVCPSCGHEWTSTPEVAEADNAVRDANGNVLVTGDSVIVIKDLKVKGSSLVIKGGTKVKKIRLVDGDHDIDCKIDGIGSIQLKSEFVRKA